MTGLPWTAQSFMAPGMLVRLAYPAFSSRPRRAAPRRAAPAATARNEKFLILRDLGKSRGQLTQRNLVRVRNAPFLPLFRLPPVQGKPFRAVKLSCIATLSPLRQIADFGRFAAHAAGEQQPANDDQQVAPFNFRDLVGVHAVIKKHAMPRRAAFEDIRDSVRQPRDFLNRRTGHQQKIFEIKEGQRVHLV